MTFYDFAHGSPYIALVMLIVMLGMVSAISRRITRAISIWRHGWPVVVDADGDAIKGLSEADRDALAEEIADKVLAKLYNARQHARAAQYSKARA